MQKKGGYGIVYQEVMRNSNLSAEAKAIYAYLSSIAGVGGTCYPSLTTMQRDLGMSRNRITKHINQLLSMGIVEKARERTKTGFGPNVYKVTHEIKVAEEFQSIFQAIENEDNAIVVENVALQNEALRNEALQNEVLQNIATNNNNININKIYNNSNKVHKAIKAYFPDDDLLNQAFADYVEMRKQIKKPMTEKAVTLAIKKLRELAAVPFSDALDNNLAIQILNQSVMNSWQGLFPLREQKVNYQGKEGGAEDRKGNQTRGQASDYFKRFVRCGDSDQN